MAEWKRIYSLQDLPQKDGEYLVNVHFICDYGAMFLEPEEIVKVTSAYFRYEQKIWELNEEQRINALCPIFDVFDTDTTDYIDCWSEMPEPPKGE